MTEFQKKYGPYAIVTGASAGLGEAFAEELAKRGVNLVLVARRKEKLDALAARLTAAYKVTAKPVALDLAQEGAVDILLRETETLDIGLVVINAALLVMGRFLDNDLKKETDVFRLNAFTAFLLAHHYGNQLRRKGRGGLLFVSSLIGFAVGPYQANYAATKAYISSLGQALHAELKPSGVDVLVLAAGGMNTEGVQNLGLDFSKMPFPVVEPRPVAKLGLDTLKKKAVVIPGVINNFSDFLTKHLLPRSVSTRLFGSVIAKAFAIK